MNKWQKALDDMKRHIVGIPVLKYFYIKDADLLQKLVDEKVEFESRKDKLIVGSQWECVIQCIIQNRMSEALERYIDLGGKLTIKEVFEKQYGQKWMKLIFFQKWHYLLNNSYIVSNQQRKVQYYERGKFKLD